MNFLLFKEDARRLRAAFWPHLGWIPILVAVWGFAAGPKTSWGTESPPGSRPPGANACALGLTRPLENKFPVRSEVLPLSVGFREVSVVHSGGFPFLLFRNKKKELSLRTTALFLLPEAPSLPLKAAPPIAQSESVLVDGKPWVFALDKQGQLYGFAGKAPAADPFSPVLLFGRALGQSSRGTFQSVRLFQAEGESSIVVFLGADTDKIYRGVARLNSQNEIVWQKAPSLWSEFPGFDFFTLSADQVVCVTEVGAIYDVTRGTSTYVGFFSNPPEDVALERNSKDPLSYSLVSLSTPTDEAGLEVSRWRRKTRKESEAQPFIISAHAWKESVSLSGQAVADAPDEALFYALRAPKNAGNFLDPYAIFLPVPPPDIGPWQGETSDDAASFLLLVQRSHFAIREKTRQKLSQSTPGHTADLYREPLSGDRLSTRLRARLSLRQALSDRPRAPEYLLLEFCGLYGFPSRNQALQAIRENAPLPAPFGEMATLLSQPASRWLGTSRRNSETRQLINAALSSYFGLHDEPTPDWPRFLRSTRQHMEGSGTLGFEVLESALAALDPLRAIVDAESLLIFLENSEKGASEK